MTTEETYFKLAAVLRARRARLNKTLEDVAQYLSISKAMISMWENGKRTPNMIEMLGWCKFLGVRLGDLLNIVATPDGEDLLVELATPEPAPVTNGVMPVFRFGGGQ